MAQAQVQQKLPVEPKIPALASKDPALQEFLAKQREPVAPLPEVKQITREKKVLTYEEVVAHAKNSVVSDFRRIRDYKASVAAAKETTASAVGSRMIEDEAVALDQIQTTRPKRKLTIEDSTSFWTPQMQQFGLFGTACTTGLASVMFIFFAFRINHLFILGTPVLAGIAQRSWLQFEEVNEEMKYLANQQAIRERRLSPRSSSTATGTAQEEAKSTTAAATPATS